MDSFNTPSTSTSAASSNTGLHECLAPGFLRAAKGNVHPRPYSCIDDTIHDYIHDVFPPGVGENSPLPTASSSRAHGLDRQYPDLSTVPERDHQITSTLPKHLRVVGQGRPGRKSAHTNVDGTPISDPGSASTNNTSRYPFARRASASESATNVGPSSSATSQPFSLAAALANMTLPHVTPPRPDSPDVLFPEDLRSDDEEEGEPERPKPVDVFPSIHDMTERDLFQDVFSNRSGSVVP
jgi:hypothetical protein